MAKATPDGYTLLVVASSITINPSLHKKLPFDPMRDLVPITQLSAFPNMLVAHPSLPVKSVQDLIALARAKPGQINYGSSGTGTGTHLSMVHVPYKGTGRALNDVVSGQVQMMFMNLLPALPQVKSGKLRGLAVTSARRSPAAPDIPTIAETGVAGYESTSWHGIVVPAKTPAAVAKRLHGALAGIARLPEIRERLEAQGTHVIGSTPEEFAAMIKTETVKWSGVIKTAGIKPE